MGRFWIWARTGMCWNTPLEAWEWADIICILGGRTCAGWIPMILMCIWKRTDMGIVMNMGKGMSTVMSMGKGMGTVMSMGKGMGSSHVMGKGMGSSHGHEEGA